MIKALLKGMQGKQQNITKSAQPWKTRQNPSQSFSLSQYYTDCLICVNKKYKKRNTVSKTKYIYMKDWETEEKAPENKNTMVRVSFLVLQRSRWGR